MPHYPASLFLSEFPDVCSLSLLVVRHIDYDAAQRAPLCRRMWLLNSKAEAQTRPHTCRRISATLLLGVVGCAVGVSAHALLLPNPYVAAQMLPAPCRKLHDISLGRLQLLMRSQVFAALVSK